MPVPDAVCDGVPVLDGDGVMDGVPVPEGDGAGPTVDGASGASAIPRYSARGVRKPTLTSLFPELAHAGVLDREAST